MAISAYKTWVSGEVLTASDLNSSFAQIINNATSLITPATAAWDMNGFELILDADADTSITADTDDQIDFRVSGIDTLVLTGSALTFLGAPISPSTDANSVLANAVFS